MIRPLTLLASAMALLWAGLASADEATIDETIVFVECKTPDQPTRRGSGVMITEDGLLLTAKHVLFGKADDLPDGTACKGVVGDAGLPKADLVVQDYSTRYDAALLRMPLPPAQTVKRLRFCRLNDEMLGADIIAAGFPLETTTHRPSLRAGVLATVDADSSGLIETDSQTTKGMSGGMVRLGRTGALVGLIAGLKTDNDGLPDTYKVLAVWLLAREFGDLGLTEAGSDVCPPARLTDEVVWSSGLGPKLLGLKEADGFCYLTRTFGRFDHVDDKVLVELDPDGEYRITGESGGNGPHGGAGRCVRY